MPNVDVQRVYSKLSAVPRGIDMGSEASLIGDDQLALAINLSLRGDLATTRSPWTSIPLDTELSGLFQGSGIYETPDLQGILFMVSGRLYFVEINPNDLGIIRDVTPRLPITTTVSFTVPAPAAIVVVSVTSETPFTTGDTIYIDSGQYTVTNRFTDALQLTYVGGAANAVVASGVAVLDSTNDPVIEYETYPTALDFVHIFQAERYGIVLGLQQKPIIFDGVNSKLATTTQIPSGVLGLYAWGRLWIVLSDLRSFVAGDIVYGPSGTPQNGFVDAILYFTENDFLNEGGFFGVPNNAGPITSLLALATIDTSLGIGPILVGTANSVVSVNAPVDRTTWKNLTYPIQTISLLDYGPLGPRSTISINNDMWYRAIDGIRSFIVGRRSMAGLGNTPLSHEVSPVLNQDTESLLRVSSAVLFDNKAFFTVAPRQTGSGVVHDGLAVINFDPLSTISGKQPPIWEGFTSGLPILQIVRGRIASVERAFAFCLNETTNKIELWELLAQGYYDTYRLVSGPDTTIVRTAIQSVAETKRYSYERLVKLIMGELYVDDIVDEVILTVKFRPDEYPSWITWATIRLCATVSQCTIATPGQFSCQIWKPNARTYAARIRLPRPNEDCNTIAGIPLDRGYEFQFRLEGQGHYRLRKFRPHLRIQTDSQEGECPATQAVCTVFPECPSALFNYQISRS